MSPVDGKSNPQSGFARLIKLLVFAGGIYGAFLQYGNAQEEIYKCPKGIKDCEKIDVWFVNCCEAIANVLVGGIALLIVGNINGLPIECLRISALFQQGAKGCTNLAMVYKMPFAITTLAKSGKMIPVMIGSIFIGGKKYSWLQIASVLAIVMGTVLVSMYSGEKKGHGSSSSSSSQDISQYIGVAFLVASLAFDGVVAGKQTEMDTLCKERKIQPSYSRAFAMMFWTNLFMSGIALLAAIFNYEKTINYLTTHSEIYTLIGTFAVCSAVGQTFIFLTITEFDPLTTTTITTTRKIFSVLLSIYKNNTPVEPIGWFGLAIASAGIVYDIFEKMKPKEDHKTATKEAKSK